jgi:hypothetical protein
MGVVVSTQENPKFFGKIGLADLCVIAVGAGTLSNFASLFTRDPQTVIYLGYGGMLLGALASRYAIVKIIGYINANFENNPKKSFFVKIAYLLGFLVLAATFAISKVTLDQNVQVGSNYSPKNSTPIEEMLPKFASQLNAKLPMMVDSDTRLDSVMGVNRTLRYNYTLISHSSSDVTEQDIRNAFQQKIENRVCTSQESLTFIKNGVTLTYAYYGNEGKQISVISVSSSQCSKAQ